MEKYDIVNGLAREFGFRRYLEICTPTTGRKYQFVDVSHFNGCDRLIYRCPADFADGFDIAFRTAADSADEVLAQLDATLSADERYDIILVDPYHTYRNSLSDLHGAKRLLRPGGVLVVHDCNPTDPETVQPIFREGDWCGVTYQAYIDFVLDMPSEGYCTVDVDYGCGVVFDVGARMPAAWRNARPAEWIALDWIACREDDAQRFELFERHRAALLNLVPAGKFQSFHPLTEPAATSATDSVKDLEPHLVADGHRIDPLHVGDDERKFLIPADVRSVRLKSRSIQPSAIGPSDDHRRLGLCLTSLVVQTGAVTTAVPIDHPWLSQGLHEVERAGGRMWRWTDGDTPLPLSLLGEGKMPVVLTVRANALRI